MFINLTAQRKFLLQHLIFFLLIILTSIYTRWMQTSINDDWLIWNLVKDGEVRVLLVNIIFSKTLSSLYNWFPSIQWLSFFYLILIFISFLNIFIYLSNLERSVKKIMTIIFIYLAFLYFLHNINFTILTTLVFVTSVLHFQNRILLFWISISVATLIRTNIIVYLIPFMLLLIPLIITHTPRIRSKYNLLILIPIFIIAFDFVYLSNDSEYSQWKQFNLAKSYFIDFSGDTNTTSLTKEESIIVSTWWLEDEIILPSTVIIDASKNIFELVLEKIISPSLSVSFYVFMFFLLFIAYSEQSKRKVLFLLLLLAYLFLLSSFRDVARISFGLYFIIAIIIFCTYQSRNKKYSLHIIYFSIVFFIILSSLNIYFSYKYITLVENYKKMFNMILII